ncbi:immunoglobulin-like domain-containing protein [Staphylococcus sp. 11261D007BR]
MKKLLQSLSAIGVSATLVSPNLNAEATTNTIPSIKGTDNTIIHIGQSCNPLEGVSAYDKEDGDLTDQIKVNGFVDTSKQGKYHLNYEVVDSDGAIQTSSRTIQVIDPTTSHI